MQLINDWLSSHNLPGRREDPTPLEGESLAYVLVAYAVRPNHLPPEVVESLATHVFGRLISDDEN